MIDKYRPGRDVWPCGMRVTTMPVPGEEEVCTIPRNADYHAVAPLDGVDAVVEQRSCAVHAVAAAAMDAADCRELLDALGLSPEEGLRQVPISARGR